MKTARFVIMTTLALASCGYGEDTRAACPRGGLTTGNAASGAVGPSHVCLGSEVYWTLCGVEVPEHLLAEPLEGVRDPVTRMMFKELVAKTIRGAELDVIAFLPGPKACSNQNRQTWQAASRRGLNQADLEAISRRTGLRLLPEVENEG